MYIVIKGNKNVVEKVDQMCYLDQQYLLEILEFMRKALFDSIQVI